MERYNVIVEDGHGEVHTFTVDAMERHHAEDLALEQAERAELPEPCRAIEFEKLDDERIE